jgi:hypothetical protein
MATTMRPAVSAWNRLDLFKLAKLQSLELPAKVEVMDKSKSDWISKSITSIQVVWSVLPISWTSGPETSGHDVRTFHLRDRYVYVQQ